MRRLETTNGTINAESPKMKSTLKILLPTTLPKAMSAFPAQAAWTETANSGELVPKATTVNPITKGEIFIAAANLDAPRTSSSPPAISENSPKMIFKTGESHTSILRSIRPICGAPCKLT